MIKSIKCCVLGLLALSVIATLLAYATGNGFLVRATYMTYFHGHVTANINDHKAFDVSVIATEKPAALPHSPHYNQSILPEAFKARLEKFGTAAFLVAKDGELVSETYLNGYHDRSKTNSFSMAKTVTTLLVGIAIEEGYIESLEQNLTDFLPEFKDDALGNKATIGQLSLMNSGYEWREHYYSAFSPTVELLYGADVTEFLLAREFSAEPGSFWEYSSASTQLLAIVLKRALAAKGKAVSLSEYLSEKIWRPLQMNDDALWHTDSTGMELAFCCISTNARNYAKLGMLMLNSGEWNGQQIIQKQFINHMTKPLGNSYYGYSTWLSLDSDPAYFWYSGHLGQYIINIPEHNIVIVRLGETRDNSVDFRTVELPKYVALALEMTQ